MSAPEYSIIIPAYNEEDELRTTLASIFLAMASQSTVGECIVVDNNSTDRTAKIAKTYGADRVVFEPINQIARARNTGAAASQGTYLIFVDADTRIQPELLSESLRLLRDGQTVGGGSLVRFEGEIPPLGRFGIELWERISKLTRTAAGSYLFCRRDAFEAVGGFDLKLYASEEVRLSRLLRKWGKQHQKRFEIVTVAPAQTSPRKLDWYSDREILKWIGIMVLLPFAVRSRRHCGFWYDRPRLKIRT